MRMEPRPEATRASLERVDQREKGLADVAELAPRPRRLACNGFRFEANRPAHFLTVRHVDVFGPRDLS
jgi:hypothetical protein